MKIELPQTPEQYKSTISDAGTSCTVFVLVAAIFALMAWASADVAFSGSSGPSDWVETPAALPWAAAFAGLMLLFTKYAIHYFRLYGVAKQKMVDDLYAMVKSSGFYEFPDRDDYARDLRKAAFAGDPTQLLDLCEKQRSREALLRALEKSLKFAEEKNLYNSGYEYIFPNGKDPMYIYKLRMRYVDETQRVDSPELMDLLWQNSNEAQRQIWREVAAKGEWHDIFRVFPTKAFSEFIASKMCEHA